ncbi:hypothetical protein [Mycolicibacterium sp. CBMA 226]|uniref:hypothetical protein n=1 Tax=Mycolicibacterium sp. CBMA 226 TaxID=2606611 RepID=UPI0012DF9659|nr:hypothetical protein [Mycolicibacterium sp. CBMA 226]MUL78766.1 hypothetical protein [Mycolicibacterium sp. CBMA 226]
MPTVSALVAAVTTAGAAATAVAGFGGVIGLAGVGAEGAVGAVTPVAGWVAGWAGLLGDAVALDGAGCTAVAARAELEAVAEAFFVDLGARALEGSDDAGVSSCVGAGPAGPVGDPAPVADEPVAAELSAA